jgi:hypothetical protein
MCYRGCRSALGCIRPTRGNLSCLNLGLPGVLFLDHLHRRLDVSNVYYIIFLTVFPMAFPTACLPF